MAEQSKGRRSWLGYARILRSVYDEKQSTTSLARQHNMVQEGMRCIMRRLLYLDLVHICDVESSRNHLIPVWAFGAGPSLELPNNTPLRPGVELIAFANMLRALTKPQSALSLARVAGVGEDRAALLLRQMRCELRMVHIVGDHKSGRRPGGKRAALYALGFDQPDVARTPPLPDKVINARQSAKRALQRRQREAYARLAANAFVFTLASAA